MIHLFSKISKLIIITISIIFIMMTIMLYHSLTSELPMPTARHGLGATSYEDGIYVMGGGPQPGLSASDANEVYHTR